MSEPILQVYPPGFPHDDAYIVANVDGLLKLGEIISSLVNAPSKHGYRELFTSDGEGYTLHVLKVGDRETLNRLAVPYSEEHASEKNDAAVWPWDLRKIEGKKKLEK